MLRLLPLQLATLAAALSLSIIPLMRHFASRLGLVDLPEARKVHSMPTPRVGGWGITVGSVLSLALWLKFDPSTTAFVAGVCVLFAFGIWDDIKQIGHWQKFLGQLLAVGAVVCYGGLVITHLPLIDTPIPAWIGRPLTIFSLIGAINATNHSDGLDGLAAGESILTLIGAAILGYLSGNIVVIGIALALFGAILGFLRYNSHPARVFMGDSGSQVLGFTLGYLTLDLTQRADTAYSAGISLLLLGLPIADILMVLWQRIRSGENWFRATRNHLHHRLLDIGFAHYQTVIILYSVHALLVMAAVLLRYHPDSQVLGVYLGVLAGLFLLLSGAEAIGWRANRPLERGSIARAFASAFAAIDASSERVILAAALLLMVLGAIWAAHVPHEIGVVAAVLAPLLAAELWLARDRDVRLPIVRLSVYLAAIASSYLYVYAPGVIAYHDVEWIVSSLIGVMMLAIAVHVWRASPKRFDTTPTDYLIGFVLIALVVFAGFEPRLRPVVQIIVYAVVLLYGCEVMMGAAARRGHSLQVAAILTLTIIAARGLI